MNWKYVVSTIAGYSLFGGFACKAIEDTMGTGFAFVACFGIICLMVRDLFSVQAVE